MRTLLSHTLHTGTSQGDITSSEDYFATEVIQMEARLMVKTILQRQMNDRAKRLTMLVHKSQPRNHLKHDVPNLILCEHLILPKRRQDGGK